MTLPAEAEVLTTLVMPRSRSRDRAAAARAGWPAREGRPELKLLKRLLGWAAYSTQKMQGPQSAGGLIFRPEWFRFFDECPPLDEVAQSWDMTFKDSKDDDYVVGLVGGRVGADIYLMRIRSRDDGISRKAGEQAARAPRPLPAD